MSAGFHSEFAVYNRHDLPDEIGGAEYSGTYAGVLTGRCTPIRESQLLLAQGIEAQEAYSIRARLVPNNPNEPFEIETGDHIECTTPDTVIFGRRLLVTAIQHTGMRKSDSRNFQIVTAKRMPKRMVEFG